MKILGLVFDVLVGMLFIGGAVQAAWRGKIQLRDGYVWKRSEDPLVFWGMIFTFAGGGVAAITLAAWTWLGRSR